MKYKIKLINEEILFRSYEKLMEKIEDLIATGQSFTVWYYGLDCKWHFYNIKVV